MKNLFFVAIATLFLAVSCSTPSSTTATPTKPTDGSTPTEEVANTLVKFNNSDDIDGALAMAKKQKKVLFIDFYTTWCAPCRVMEQGTFRDEDIADYMNENCICIRVNAEKGKGPEMKIAYAVDAYPTMLFYASNGDEVARKQGSMGIEEFKIFMKSSVWKARNPAGKP